MDTKLPYYKLTQRQQLSVHCDHGAKALAKSLITPLPIPTSIVTENWSLLMNGIQITWDIGSTICGTLEKWKWRICSQCGKDVEAVQPVLQCDHAEAMDQWKSNIHAAWVWMGEDIKTQPVIIDAILRGCKPGELKEVHTGSVLKSSQFPNPKSQIWA